MQKITDMAKIKELYESGKISRATYFRGKKRGYICLDYNKPHKSGNKNFRVEEFWDEWLDVMADYRKICHKQIFGSKKTFFNIDEALNEGALYLIERQIMPRDGFAHFRSYISSIVRGKSKAAIMTRSGATVYRYIEEWIEHNK